MDIPKTYDPKQAEERHYANWEAGGYFAPEINRDANAPVYSIVIPPPNVTGSLHMGHALQHTFMDVMARHKRMCGYRTLWLPGMDHAGISTQLMVRREGASVDWSRERFTMDEGLSRAVREVFVRLYEEGHIYRGNRIVNWCPQ